jgi:hypothetical protein
MLTGMVATPCAAVPVLSATDNGARAPVGDARCRFCRREGAVRLAVCTALCAGRSGLCAHRRVPRGVVPLPGRRLGALVRRRAARPGNAAGARPFVSQRTAGRACDRPRREPQARAVAAHRRTALVLCGRAREQVCDRMGERAAPTARAAASARPGGRRVVSADVLRRGNGGAGGRGLACASPRPAGAGVAFDA